MHKFKYEVWKVAIFFPATRGPKYSIFKKQKTKSKFLILNPTYFPVQTVSHKIFVESFHVAWETPESVHLRVKNLQEAAAQVIHALSITHR